MRWKKKPDDKYIINVRVIIQLHNAPITLMGILEK